MGTDVTVAGEPIVLTPSSCQALTNLLQPLLGSAPLLTLIIVAGEVPAGSTADALFNVKACLDDVERVLCACLRRSDKILRCGEYSCAAVLLGAQAEGALRAVDRFRCMLDTSRRPTVPLHVGLASAPEEGIECQSLLALASRSRLCIPSPSGIDNDALPGLNDIGQNTSLAPRAPGAGRDRRERRSVPARKIKTDAALPAPALFSETQGCLERLAPQSETLARLRARALGIPYLAPPQHIPSNVRNLLPLEVMRQLHCLPIGRERNSLTVALADPTDSGVLHRLEEITGLHIFPVMTDPDALEALAQPARSRRASQMSSAPASSSCD